MIVAESTFRVANGLDEEVADAFVARPRRVEDAPGFLGIEVFRDADDPSVFVLVTRWTDRSSFETWHGGEEHRLSHDSIPKGLRLDPSHTRIRVLERLPEASKHRAGQELLDALPLLSRVVDQALGIAVVRVDGEGRVAYCNEGFARLVEESREGALGQPFADYLADDSAAEISQRLESGRPEGRGPVLIRLSRSQETWMTTLDPLPRGFLLAGEAQVVAETVLAERLHRLNNDLAVVARERAREQKRTEAARKELAATLHELETSYWHLRKIQEVLPICMECGQVKSGQEWQDVVTYLKENSLFLSHGYCPDCEEKVLAGLP